MTNDELNQYILHYLTEDKTQSAIMLTGDWGTGKSYYINNTLKPFLEKDENGNHQCIVVSLYGIKETVEISKAMNPMPFRSTCMAQLLFIQLSLSQYSDVISRK